MALKLLQPGLRPMGQFDIDSDTATNTTGITGGELMTLSASTGAAEYAAADLSNGTSPAAEASMATGTADMSTTDAIIGFLADDGIRGYGTMFGELIGNIAGQATSVSGATVIGPRTSSGSGKVTLHHGPGLYGFSAPADGSTTAVGGSSDCWVNASTVPTATGTKLYAASGKWQTATNATDQAHCVMIGAVNDSSLVSTTLAAAGESALNEFFAVYFLGPIGTQVIA